MKIKKGDSVLIISGKDRGKTGQIEAVFPVTNRVMVAGANLYKKHMKPSAKHPQGGIIELSRSLHASNVMIIESETKKPTRIGYAYDNQDKVRIARLTGK